MPAQPERELPAEHHVWTPEEGGDDVARFDRYTVVFLHQMRWREPPRDRRRFGIALVLALLLHAGFVGFLSWESRLEPFKPVPRAPESTQQQAISVTLYEAPPPAQVLPPPPPIELPPPGAPPRVVHPVPRAPHSIAATLRGTPPAPRVYNAQGQALLPPGAANAAAGTPDYIANTPQASPLMQQKSPVTYKPTQFEKDWAPLNEGPIGRTFRRAVEAATAKKTIRLGDHVKITCVASPLLLMFGCGGQDPPPPPKNDDDPRLSLPPTVSLTGRKVAVPATASSGAAPAKATSSPTPRDRHR